MKTFVFVHGACHGGWCWSKLVDKLQKENCKIVTPTLTGMGERKHLLSKDITVQTHIDDIANVILYENLENIILVGHSYAGLVIAGVNEVVPDKISQLVFLDAYIPENGKTGFEVLEKKYQDSWEHVAQKDGEGWRMPANESSLDIWGVHNEEDRNFLRNRITDFSINFMKTPILLSSHFEKVKKAYIRCTEPSYCYDLMQSHFERAQQLKWPIYTIKSTHEPMITHVDELTKILLKTQETLRFP